jgi:hypothetical protein
MCVSSIISHEGFLLLPPDQPAKKTLSVNPWPLPTLELGQRGEDAENQLAGGGRRIDGRAMSAVSTFRPTLRPVRSCTVLMR